MQCPVCNSDVPEGFRFCGSCGSELATRSSPATHPVAIDEDRDIQRRRLTVMFCDLIDSTPLSTLMDPEDNHQIVRQYHRMCGAVLEQHGGFLALHLGDGILAYFGHPEAREDDAARAVQAGLSIVAEIVQLVPSVPLPRGFSLGVRVGIHTGEVVTAEVGPGPESAPMALGMVPNVAARLQGLAERNSVVVSDSTYSLTAGDFEYLHLGLTEIKGLQRPILVHRPLRRVTLRESFQAAHRGPMVGRERELEHLLAKVEETRGVGARAVCVVGSPGIGKTRLALALEDRLADREHDWLVCRCASDGRASFLRPIADMLLDWIGDAAEDGEVMPQTLERALFALFGHADESRSRALCHLLGFANPEGSTWLQGRPEDQKERIFTAVLEWIGAHAGERPLVFMVEDFHWADPSTTELVERALRTFRHAPTLLLLLERPEAPIAEWLARYGVEVLPLEPLSAEKSLELIADCCPEIGADTAREIVARGDGIPLFLQELARVAASENDPSDSGAPLSRLPGRLRDLLTIKLERLGDSKRVAAMAAVIGVEFAMDLLAKMSGMEPSVLDEHLQRLVREAVIVRQTADSYVFKHALIRDAAVANVLRRDLRVYHRRVAEALELYYPEEAGLRPERLARHWAYAQVLARALSYFSTAADRARSVYANAEAISLFQEALELGESRQAEDADSEISETLLHLLEGLGDVLALERRNTEAIATLTSALERSDPSDRVRRARLHRKAAMASRGEEPHGIPRMHEALTELSGTPAADPDLWWKEWLQIKFELSITYYQLGRVAEMIEVASEIEPLVRRYGTAHQQAELANQLLLIDRRLHRFAATPASLRHCNAFAEAAERTGDLPLQAAAVTARAMTLMDHGSFTEAEAEFERALALSARAGHRSAEIRALTYFAVLRRRQGDVGRAVQLSERAGASALAGDMPVYIATSDAVLAWAAWRTGELDRTIELGERALAGLSAASARSPFFWVGALPLAAAYFEKGDLERAVERLATMTKDDQQMLTRDLMGAIEAAQQARGDCEDTVRAALEHALSVAKRERYL